MLAKYLKVIVGIAVVCLLFAGVAVANPGRGGNDAVGVKKDVVKKTVIVKKTVKDKAAEVKKQVVKKVVVKKVEKNKPVKVVLGAVAGKTLLDMQKATATTTGTTSTVETSTAMANVHLRLYMSKKTKWGFEHYKTAYAAQSNKNGAYLFRNVKPGTYVLKTWSLIAMPVSDATITVTVKANEVTAVPDIHFVRHGMVAGKTLLDIQQVTTSTAGTTSTVESSTALGNVHLRLFVPKKTRWGFEYYRTTNIARSDKNGEFVFRNVKPGAYVLKVWSPTAVPVSDATINVVVKSNETVTVPDIHFKPRPEK